MIKKLGNYFVFVLCFVLRICVVCFMFFTSLFTNRVFTSESQPSVVISTEIPLSKTLSQSSELPTMDEYPLTNLSLILSAFNEQYPASMSSCSSSPARLRGTAHQRCITVPYVQHVLFIFVISIILILTPTMQGLMTPPSYYDDQYDPRSRYMYQESLLGFANNGSPPLLHPMHDYSNPRSS